MLRKKGKDFEVKLTIIEVISATILSCLSQRCMGGGNGPAHIRRSQLRDDS